MVCRTISTHVGHYPPPPHSHCPFRQQSGGPCGIIGAVQGFILYKLLFGTDLSKARELYGGTGPLPPAPSDAMARLSPPNDVQEATLAHALAWVIWQAMSSLDGMPLPGSTATVVVAMDDASLPLHPESVGAGTLLAHRLPPSFAAIEAFVLARIPQFRSPSGVLLLLWSVLLSRGLARVAADMDEAAPLVARFGHCTQELLSLMLTGTASSNVFDGVQARLIKYLWHFISYFPLLYRTLP